MSSDKKPSKFYSSIRLDIRKSGSAIKDKEGNIIASPTKVKVVKNKLAPPFRLALFDLIYGEGISRTGEIIDLGVDHDIVGKSGSWYSYNGTKIAQGRESAKQFLLDNPELMEEIAAKITAKYLPEETDTNEVMNIEENAEAEA